MALADYRLCDVCGRKTFYDSNLNYDFPERGQYGDEWDDQDKARGWRLERLGDWAVLCKECAATHECVIVPRATE
jgi:hypothetical protein